MHDTDHKPTALLETLCLSHQIITEAPMVPIIATLDRATSGAKNILKIGIPKGLFSWGRRDKIA